MKKKITSLFLAFVLCLTLSIPTFAANTRYTENGCKLIETIDENHKIIRTMDRDIGPKAKSLNSNSLINNHSNIKQDLLSLGFEKDTINKLSEAQLQSFDKSSKLKLVIQYSKVDENGVLTNVSEQEALQKSAEIMSASRSQKDTVKDSYMKVTFSAGYMGNARYAFLTKASWLTLPLFRGKDSIGGCAMNCTVIPGTQEAHLEYEHVKYRSNGSISRSVPEEGDVSIENASKGNFYGSGAIFDLPEDTYYSHAQGTIRDSYIDISASFYYQGHVNYPDETAYFNATGTYTHTTIGIGVSPSLSISLDGHAPTASIGIDIRRCKEPRTAEVEVEYIP